jgi:hypothetical protein
MQFEIVGDKLFLNIPTFVALELYRRAIFPQDTSKSVSVKISGKDVGRFLIIDLRYPEEDSHKQTGRRTARRRPGQQICVYLRSSAVRFFIC